MANRYWVGDSGPWNNTTKTHWSSSSGGAGGASVPTNSDNVYFDLNSFSGTGQTVTISAAVFCNNLHFETVTNAPTISVSSSLTSINIYGSLSSAVGHNVTVTHTGTESANGNFRFDNAGTVTADFSGITFDKSCNWYGTYLSLNASGGMVTLLSNLEVPYVVLGGTDLNGYNIKANLIATQAGTIYLRTAQITIYNDYITDNNGIYVISTTTAINAGTSKITFEVNEGINDAVLSDITLYDLEVKTGLIFHIATGDHNISFHNVTINPGCSFQTTHYLTNNTVTFNSLTINGTAGSHITIKSDSAGHQCHWSVVAASASYCDVKDNNVSGAGSPVDDTNGGTNNGNNSGWLFPAAPVADFSGTPLSGTMPLSVSFTDLSTYTPTSWLWDFQNDGTQTSILQNPTHIYAVPGTYTVKLTATNSIGSDSKTRTNYITVTVPTFYQQYNAGTEGKLVIAPPRGTTNNPILDASGVTATRTYTYPNVSGTIALTGTTLTATRVPFANASGLLVDDADLTFVTDTLYATKVAMSSLTSGRVPYATTLGLLIDSTNLQFDGTYLIVNSIKDSALTSGRVPYASTNGLLIDNTNFQYNGSYLMVPSIKDAALATPGRLVDVGVNNILQDTYTPVTSVGSPGSNTNIPTEAAVRTAIGAVLTNPMTTIGDIIYSNDNSGTPERRAVPIVGFWNVLSVYGDVGEVPDWRPATLPLTFAICNNDEVVCLNDEIIYI